MKKDIIIVKNKTETEEKINKINRANKGGRPKKQEHLDQKLTTMCIRLDAITIRYYSKEFNLNILEYLKFSALKRQVDRKIKTLPKEVLQFIGTLHHLKANINQVTHKRNRGDELNAIERAELAVLAGEIKELAKKIKAELK